MNRYDDNERETLCVGLPCENSKPLRVTDDIICPIKVLSKDEWVNIISFLEIEKKNYFPLSLLYTCKSIFGLLHWKSLLGNVCLPSDNLTCLYFEDRVVQNPYNKKNIGKKIFDVVCSNWSLRPELIPKLIRVAVKMNEYDWDWETALLSTKLPNEYYDHFHLPSETFQFIERLAVRHSNSRNQEVIIDVLLQNSSLKGSLRTDLLELAVAINSTYWATKLLKNQSFSVKGIMNKAISHGTNEIAALLKRDQRVIDEQLNLCSECGTLQFFICCAGCDRAHCTECNQGLPICVICDDWYCDACGVDNVVPCSTCQKNVCRDGYSNHCSHRCDNRELCSKIQCDKCYKGDYEWTWYSCSSRPHVLCIDCNPTQLAFDIKPNKVEHNEDCERSVCFLDDECPACQEQVTRKCWNSDFCGHELELNLVQGSRDWYRCTDAKCHTFCPGCDPTKGKDELIEKYIELGIDLERCPACQGLVASGGILAMSEC